MIGWVLIQMKKGDLLDEHLRSHVIRESSTQNGLSDERISSLPKEDSLFSLVDPTPSSESRVASTTTTDTMAAQIYTNLHASFEDI